MIKPFKLSAPTSRPGLLKPTLSTDFPSQSMATLFFVIQAKILGVFLNTSLSPIYVQTLRNPIGSTFKIYPEVYHFFTTSTHITLVCTNIISPLDYCKNLLTDFLAFTLALFPMPIFNTAARV